MSKFDKKMYRQGKKALREAIAMIKKEEKNVFEDLPVIVIDKGNREVICFPRSYEATDYIQKHVKSSTYSNNFDDFEVIAFQKHSIVKQYPKQHETYKFFREINDEWYYRAKKKIEFIPVTSYYPSF